MPGPVYLEGDRLRLRTVESADEEFIRRHWNAPDMRHFFAKSEPMDRDHIAAFLESGDRETHFLPCRDGEPVGFVWLLRIDDVADRGEIGYWIRPEDRGQGYGTEAAALGLRYGFDERGLHKIMARVFEGNTPSRQVLERLGFEEEGNLRDHYFVNGEYLDAALFGLLSDERESGSPV